MGKFRGSAQNSAFHGKLWSLLISVMTMTVYDLIRECESTEMNSRWVGGMGDPLLREIFLNFQVKMQGLVHLLLQKNYL